MHLQKLFLSSCLALVCMISMGTIVQAAEGDDVASDPRGSRFHRPVQNVQLDDEIGDEVAMQDAPPLLDDGTGEENGQDAPPVLDDGIGEENEQDASLDEAEQSDDEGMSDGEMAGLIAGSVAGAAVGATAIAAGIKASQKGKNKGSQYEVVEDDRRSLSDDDSIRLSENSEKKWNAYVEEGSKKQAQKDDRAKKLGGLSKDEQVKFQQLVDEERAKAKEENRKSGSQLDFEEKKEVVRSALEKKDAEVVVDDEQVKSKKQQALDAAKGETAYRKLLRNEMQLQDEISETKRRINEMTKSEVSAEQLDVEKNLLLRQQREFRQVGEKLQAGDQLVADGEKRKAIIDQEGERHVALKEKLQNPEIKQDVKKYKRAVQANINVQENIDFQQKRIEQYQDKKKKTQNPVTKIMLDRKIKNEQKQLRLKQDGLFEAQKDLQNANETLKARKLSDVDREVLKQEAIRKAEAQKKQQEKAKQAKKKAASKRLFPNAREIGRASCRERV